MAKPFKKKDKFEHLPEDYPRFYLISQTTLVEPDGPQLQKYFYYIRNNPKTYFKNLRHEWNDTDFNALIWMPISRALFIGECYKLYPSELSIAFLKTNQAAGQNIIEGLKKHYEIPIPKDQVKIQELNTDIIAANEEFIVLDDYKYNAIKRQNKIMELTKELNDKWDIIEHKKKALNRSVSKDVNF